MNTPMIKTPLRDRNRIQSQNNREYNHKSRELMDIKKKFNYEKDRADDLELEVKSKDGVIKKLREELDSYKKKIRSQNDEMANMVSLDIYEKLNLEVKEFKGKHDSLTSDFKFAQTQIKDLEDELRSSWNSNQELSLKFEEAMKDMEKIAKEFVDYTELKSKYQDIQQKYEVLSTENEDLKQQLEAIKEQRREEMNESSVCMPLAMEANSLDIEPVSLFSEMMVKDREEELDKLKENNEKLRNENEELKSKVIGINRLNQQVETLTSQLNHTKSRLSDSYRDLKNCITKREADKKRASEQIKKLEQKSATWEKELSELKKTCSDLTARNGELNRICSELEAKVNGLVRKNAQLEDEVRILDQSFMMERRIKERMAEENRHLERMLQMDQIKLSQSVIMPPPPPPTSSSSLVSISSSSFPQSTPKMLLPPPLPSHQQQEPPSSSASSFSSCSSRRSSIYESNRKRRPPLPPGTGRALPMADEEGQFMDPRNLSDLKNGRCELPEEDPLKRLSILQGRNSLCRPHLKSSYPIEMQDINISESAIKQDTSNSKPRPTAFTISFK